VTDQRLFANLHRTDMSPPRFVTCAVAQVLDNGRMDTDTGRNTPGRRVWADPLALGFQAHRQLMLLRLRWHGRRLDTRPDGQPD